MQRRHPNKDLFPGLIDISAAGHMLAGESMHDGVRELEEEVGIAPPFEQLVSLGIYSEQLEGPGFKDNEHCHIYLYEYDGAMEQLTIQESEITAMVQILLEDIEDLLLEDRQYVSVVGFECHGGRKIPFRTTVSKKDFVPHDEAYYRMVIDGIKQHYSKK
ncbi:NUDIX hydrolase [Aquibacillus salsiterrae]|uniref:NUDIX domain-containing protein n=1 Tax=Aquibacillus salsiterrae TaxID=2950439 RepID=A0A9X3WDL1_9BACI|nr:NUDIX domain-containing protein [Aquibacillus salsiterrae]MDC3417917.1 NUDIX domain-containing protein [Aquibacillus salsiterrae]